MHFAHTRTNDDNNDDVWSMAVWSCHWLRYSWFVHRFFFSGPTFQRLTARSKYAHGCHLSSSVLLSESINTYDTRASSWNRWWSIELHRTGHCVNVVKLPFCLRLFVCCCAVALIQLNGMLSLLMHRPMFRCCHRSKQINKFSMRWEPFDCNAMRANYRK